MQRTTPYANGLTVTAHTGCMGTADNSLEAICAGIENGANIVEFDLQFSAAGVPVLSHNTPTPEAVALDDAFALLAEYKNIQVNVDVKVCKKLDRVAALAEKYNMLDRIFFTGIFEKDTDAVKQMCPLVPYWLNVNVEKKNKQNEAYLSQLVQTVKNCGAVGINMNKKNATKALVSAFHQNGLGVSLWTVNSFFDMIKAIALKPDNITTRHPDTLIKKIR